MSALPHSDPRPHEAHGVPPVMIRGAAALVLLALVAVFAGRMTDLGVARLPASAEVSHRDLRFVDRPDGGIDVLNAADGRLIDTVAPGTNGFLRGTLRGLARARRLADVGNEPAFRLTRRSDGAFTLEDLGSGQKIALEAFGPTNAAVFVRLMNLGNPTP